MIPGIVAGGFAGSASPPVPANDPYFYRYASLLHFDGADASTSMVDASGKTWSRFGNAQIDTAQSKFGGSSLLLDGTGDYLTTPHHTDFNIDTDFTVEAMVRTSATGSLRAIVYKKQTSGPFVSGWALSKLSSDVIEVVAWGAAGLAAQVVGTTALAANTWYHVAFSREGTTWRLFVNGSLEATSVETSTPANNTDLLHVGRDPSNTGRDWNGHIDELRIIKGYAVYTDSFTPPTQPFPDGYTVALLHFDDVDASTAFVDERGNVWSAVGDAQIDTAQSKFGGASGLFDGTGDYISVEDERLNLLSASRWTIEMWVRVASLAASKTGLFFNGDLASNDNRIQLEIDSTGYVNLYMQAGAGTGLSFSTPAGVVTENVWYHVAAVRRGSSVEVFVNGVSQVTGTYSSALTGDNTAHIGVTRSASTSWPMNGHIDEVRVTKGVARYVDDFTPDAAPYANLPGEAELLPSTNWVFQTGTPANWTITEDGRAAESTAGGDVWHKIRIALPRDSGKHYMEFELVANPGPDSVAIGLAPSGTATTSGQGGTANAGDGGRLQYFSSGQKRSGGVYADYGDPWVVGDRVGLAFDADANTFNMYLNGVDQGPMGYTASGSMEPHLATYGNGAKVKVVVPATVPAGHALWQ